jgi:hypothetical protein
MNYGDVTRKGKGGLGLEVVNCGKMIRKCMGETDEK